MNQHGFIQKLVIHRKNRLCSAHLNFQGLADRRKQNEIKIRTKQIIIQIS